MQIEAKEVAQNIPETKIKGMKHINLNYFICSPLKVHQLYTLQMLEGHVAASIFLLSSNTDY